jgi:hypothetical protein
MEPAELREQARRWREAAKGYDARTALALYEAADQLDAQAEQLENRLRGPPEAKA